MFFIILLFTASFYLWGDHVGSITKAYKKFNRAILIDADFLNAELNPQVPLHKCRRYVKQSKTFADLTTNYTSYYPTHSVNFNPEYHRTICSAERTDLLLLVGIMSRRNSTNRRLAIRNTFGSLLSCDEQILARYNQNRSRTNKDTQTQTLTCADVFRQIAIVFFVGQQTEIDAADLGFTNVVENNVQMEMNHFRDLIEISIPEVYKELTTKSIAFLQWASTYCASAKYVLKMDDDNYVNVGNLFKLLDQANARSAQHKHFIIGDKNVKPLVDRVPSSPWYVPYSVYPQSMFSSYQIGCGYFMPIDTARMLYEAARCVPTLYIEDVFIAGLLPSSLDVKLIGTRCISCRGIDFNSSTVVSAFAPIAIMHHIGPADMLLVWKAMKLYYSAPGSLRKQREAEAETETELRKQNWQKQRMKKTEQTDSIDNNHCALE